MAALQGGSGSESASFGGGVRDHLVWEAYIKQLANHEEVALAIRQNACTELGLPLEGAPPGLMRDLLEKRVALSEFRTLAYFATFLSFGWQEARTSSNIHLEAFCAKGLMAIEQMTLDGGRPAVGWLLTGYPEPHWNSFVKQPRSTTMRPFSNLARPSWAAANLAYLKDLDYLEGRLKSSRELGIPRGPGASDPPPGDDEKPERPRPPKGSRKGNAKGAPAPAT